MRVGDGNNVREHDDSRVTLMTPDKLLMLMCNKGYVAHSFGALFWTQNFTPLLYYILV